MEHLADIDRLVNESLQMLSRFQDLNTKVSQKMSHKQLDIFFFSFQILLICPTLFYVPKGAKVNNQFITCFHEF